jgi:hypothetical protein
MVAAIGSANSMVLLKFQDRAAYAQKVAATSQGRFTAEEIAARENESDLNQLETAQSMAGYARGEAVILSVGGGNVQIQLNMRDRPHPEFYDQRLSTLPDGRSPDLNALNVDFVIENQARAYGNDVKNIAYYAEYLQNSMANAVAKDPDHVFNGYWGADRVTHDVNEYVGWLYERAGIERPASLSEVKGVFTPPIEGLVDYDAKVIAEATRRLNAMTQPSTGSMIIRMDGTVVKPVELMPGGAVAESGGAASRVVDFKSRVAFAYGVLDAGSGALAVTENLVRQLEKGVADSSAYTQSGGMAAAQG